MRREIKTGLCILTGIFPLVNLLNAQDELNEGTSNSALSFEAAYVSDYVNGFTGTINNRRTYLGLIDIGASFSTENAGLWSGGEFYIQVENTHGGTPTGDFVNDFQVFSNIENGDNTYLYMAWLKQKFGKLSVLAGVHDLNAEFVVSEYAGLFINSSFGIMPTIAVNIPVPIFPKPALGFVTRYDATEQLSVQTAIYDGDPGDLETDPYNINHSLSKDEGILNVNELQYITGSGKGIYKAGFYYHTAEFTNYSDTTETKNGNYGVYFIGDQKLLSKAGDDNEGLGAFLQLGLAPSKYNFNCLYLGCGLSYTGLFMKNHNDALGAGIAYAKICSKYLNDYNNQWLPHETTLELTYTAQITENIAIQPDVQYIINPGALRFTDNVLVGLVRLNIGF